MPWGGPIAQLAADSAAAPASANPHSQFLIEIVIATLLTRLSIAMAG